ncbi:uncharacterized protein LOC143276777 [Babylonia areolata]|uniref:uncharacterized protein LOC143276777 n=1 Tax=Babylonia areolata TaxID=304850 RepID=UPI003FD21A9D
MTTMAQLQHNWAAAIFALCCLLLSNNAVVEAGSGQRYFLITNTRLNDVTFTDNILFPFAKVRSLLDCSRLCASRDGCKAFTYVESSRSCQGHSVRIAAGDANVDLPQARTFNFTIAPILDWVSTTCNSTADCLSKIPEPELYQTSELPGCFRTLCLCFGSWYSVSKKLCVQDCPNSQMQSSSPPTPGVAYTDTTITHFL